MRTSLKSEFLKIKWINLLLHAILILCFISIPIFTSPDFDWTFRLFKVEPFLKHFFSFLLVIVLFYVNLYGFLPFFTRRKRTGWYLVTIVLLFVVSSLTISNVFPDRMAFSQNMPFPGVPGTNRPARQLIGQELFPMLVPFTLMLFFSYVLFKYQQEKKIELDRYQSDLQQISYQLQPHFLFNSLNNIYTVSLLNPEKAPDYILQLADLLRYMLQTDHKEAVSLNDEIAFCRQYVLLQYLRYESRSENWEIHWPEANSCENMKITPFLLIPLIENVFKYGIDPDKKSPLRIEVSCQENQLMLITENLKIRQVDATLIESHKLGLIKTKERLELLYGNDFSLEIQEDDTVFKLELTIQFNAK